MIAADAPPQAVQPAQAAKAVADVVVLSRDDRSEIVTVLDTPLVLVKGARREQALVRRALFITASISVVRPTAPADGAAQADRYRWTYKSFLQRQVCFTSVTGLFSCTAAQADSLTDEETGEAPLPAAGADGEAFPQAEAARQRLAEALRLRAAAVFDADRRAKVDPIFKAAGVTVAKAGPRR